MAESGTWLPIADAAIALGVSVDTIRRKRKLGELAARPEQTAYGFRWLINLDRVTSPVDHLAQGSAQPYAAPAGASAQPRASVADIPMTEREQKFWDALQREQVANAELRVLLQRTLERQPLLESPVPPGETPSNWWATLREGNKGLGAGLTLTGIVALVGGVILHFALRANAIHSVMHLGYIIGLIGLLSLIIGLVLVF
jgi:hypothetical protein